jgi:hypothetical protein
MYLGSLLSTRLAASQQQQQQLGRVRAAMARLAGLPSGHAARRHLATDLAWVQAWQGVWSSSSRVVMVMVPLQAGVLCGGR